MLERCTETGLAIRLSRRLGRVPPARASVPRGCQAILRSGRNAHEFRRRLQGQRDRRALTTTPGRARNAHPRVRARPAPGDLRETAAMAHGGRRREPDAVGEADGVDSGTRRRGGADRCSSGSISQRAGSTKSGPRRAVLELGAATGRWESAVTTRLTCWWTSSVSAPGPRRIYGWRRRWGRLSRDRRHRRRSRILRQLRRGHGPLDRWVAGPASKPRSHESACVGPTPSLTRSRGRN